ncbi:NAD(P)-binding protein [Trichoderma citrinoviride]|uniref:NAD(P)-binding protein n=1 Tax=Trichoderma citrinoviride TaxID=58853 RepID=A0A2T4BJB9_9HYPO|nr:NAD(P)-binding protein [Trichoderma citrinoviride]PTB69405.1 NAD(P)-binding protein [Trichoderma citrinoviride]
MAGDLVLLTGATGMIGFKTLIELVKAGYTVRAAVRNQAGFERISSLKPLAPYLSQVDSVIVPDITVPGAYDEAVKGVKYVVHVASPLASTTADTEEAFQTETIQPAIQGTVGILESANKASGIEKIVITASVLSIASFQALATGTKINEKTRATSTEGPFASSIFAYAASKALAYQATEKLIAEKKPAFSVVNIMPVFVIGRDDTVTDPANIAKGTNGLLMGPLLGQPRDQPLLGIAVHVDDVAKMHVLALAPHVKGNEDYLACAHPNEPIDWAESFEIVKRRFPEAYADGVFKFESVPRPVSVPVHVDSTKAEKELGFKFKSFEELTVSVVEHYLELIGRK